MGTAATQKGAEEPFGLRIIEETTRGTFIDGSDPVRILYSVEAALTHSSFCKAATAFHYPSINVMVLSVA